MKLGNIFLANEVWGQVALLRMKPAIAYKVLKYVKLIAAEYAIVESQRVALIYEITNAEPGSQVSIEPGTPELEEYVRRFNEVLVTESELPQIEFPMDVLIEALERDEANFLTAQQLNLLEPFFKE